MNDLSRRDALRLAGLVGGSVLSRGVLPGVRLPGGSVLAPPSTGLGLAAEEGLAFAELLCRPTDRSVTLNLVPAVNLEAYVEHGQAPGEYADRTASVALAAGRAAQILVDGLPPDQRSFYRLRLRPAGAAEFTAGLERSVHTQRAAGSAFTFCVQADSHLGTAKHCDPELYRRTVQNIARAEPDFFVDLGDTFRATKLKTLSREAITRLYTNQLEILGEASHSAPIFLVNGNHDMEWGWLLDGSADSAPAMCAQARKTYFPQPEPDAFYTASAETVAPIGLVQDYYAWTWGDALFIVIDPYWHTLEDPGGVGQDNVSGDDSGKDPWTWTLGQAQYRWFKATLEASAARYKFVFHHHVLGACRGGIEWADFYEWGGRERNGRDTFAQHRPGWELPVHPLMVKHGVTIFFQGHDHLFVRQERDGIVYQTVPMAGDPTYSAYNREAFHSGDILPNTGHLRVSVAADKVSVDYVRSFLAADETDGHQNGELAFAYQVRSALPSPGPTPSAPPQPSPTARPPATPAPTKAPPQRAYLPSAENGSP